MVHCPEGETLNDFIAFGDQIFGNHLMAGKAAAALAMWWRKVSSTT
jgi:hypothetical protein